ncbi:hypothetical protein GCM10027213_56640 [Mycobacterium bourgelatii]
MVLVAVGVTGTTGAGAALDGEFADEFGAAAGGATVDEHAAMPKDAAVASVATPHRDADLPLAPVFRPISDSPRYVL